MAKTRDQYVGEEIRRLREQRGIKQSTMAAALGMGQASLSKRESGHTQVDVSEYSKFAAVLGLSLQQFRDAVNYAAELAWREQAYHNDEEYAEFYGGINTKLNELLHKPADELKVLLDQLELRSKQLKAITERKKVQKPIPISGQAPAGVGSYLGNGIERGTSEYDDDPTLPRSLCPHDEDAFAVWVAGESMEPEFKNGDLVVCSPMLAEEGLIENGDVVHVRLSETYDNENCIKRLFDAPANEDEARFVILVSDNKEHPARMVEREDIVRMAKVVKKIRSY